MHLNGISIKYIFGSKEKNDIGIKQDKARQCLFTIKQNALLTENERPFPWRSN